MPEITSCTMKFNGLIPNENKTYKYTQKYLKYNLS